ncbi:hypothetical protein, partial [Escherichia coli]|uniref:hypothetical protein n=1 Tax=Escherichia coli TaxID=562 RepID=UPI001BC8830C
MNTPPDCCNLVNGDRGDDIKRKNFLLNLFSVSYTHLTLPTITGRRGHLGRRRISKQKKANRKTTHKRIRVKIGIGKITKKKKFRKKK